MKRRTREPKPYFKTSHKAWYVQKDGKQHRLGTEYDDEAKKLYHQILAGDVEEPAEMVQPGDDPVVAVLVDDFLFALQQEVKRGRRAQATYDWYSEHLQRFAAFVGEIKVSRFKKSHLKEWLKHQYPTAGDNYLNGAVRSVSRVFNWAKEEELVSVNPVSGFKRPSYVPRECCLEDDQWQHVQSMLAAEGPFTDLVWFLYLTGCRPHEARIADSSHFDGEALIFERAKSKGKKTRMIYLEGDALEIVKRRAGNGLIFTNHLGKPWTAYALNCRFNNLRSKLTEKLGDAGRFEVFPYIFRHTFATRMLKKGIHASTVATLLGHVSTAMVEQVYGHLAKNSSYLRAELRRGMA